MHTQSDFSMLTQCVNGYIGVCNCCREFNFAYKNILLVFQEEELLSFLDWLASSRYSPDHHLPLHHGRDSVYTSPHSNLFLAFNDEELEEISTLSAEVKLMLEAQKILSHKRRKQ